MTDLPTSLQMALQEEMALCDHRSLQQASEELSNRYREKRQFIQSRGEKYILTPAQRAAYLAVRMPATYAVLCRVFEEVRERMPDLSFETLLDLGAGPGTALWAAANIFPSLKKATLIEQDAHLMETGQRMTTHSEHPLLSHAQWKQENLLNNPTLEPHDLVVLSYVIGEIPREQIEKLIDLAWKATLKALVCIEPGTPHGFSYILTARSRLIENGAQIAAPCPHSQKCPLEGIQDWCHFAQRVERSCLHRKLKEGSLGYEDEKYSYVVASKNPISSSLERIVRSPLKHSGHVNLMVCTPGGIMPKTLSRKDGEKYKAAKKANWGDSLPIR